jgi:MSHA biogenesis protein MshJ
MSNAIQQTMEKIDSRVIRERVLIFLTLLALVFFLWDFLLQSRFDNERKAIELEAQQIISERQALEGRIGELTMALATDPAIVRKNEITQLNERITKVETQLSSLSQGLISASQLPKALEDVLQKTSAIDVLQVRTLPASELQLTEEKKEALPANAATAVAEAGTGVYKHAVLIRVSGSYAQLLNLMTEIESLPWRFYWESLDYRVTEYPEAEIDIRVFTLSSEEGLLGV